MMKQIALSTLVVAVLCAAAMPGEVQASEWSWKKTGYVAGGTASVLALSGLAYWWHQGQPRGVMTRAAVQEQKRRFAAIEKRYEKDLASFEHLAGKQHMPGDQAVYLFEPQLVKIAQLPTVAKWIKQHSEQTRTQNGTVNDTTLTQDYKDASDIYAWWKELVDEMRAGTASIEGDDVIQATELRHMEQQLHTMHHFVENFKLMRHALLRHERYFMLKARMTHLRRMYKKELKVCAMPKRASYNRQLARAVKEVCQERKYCRHKYVTELNNVLASLGTLADTHYPQIKEDADALHKNLSDVKAVAA